MQPRFRVLFLIGSAAAIFHLSDRSALVLIFGYLVLEQLDDWLARRAKKKELGTVIEDELFDWNVSPDDPEYEVKNGVERVRLSGKDKIVVGRIADLIRRTTAI